MAQRDNITTPVGRMVMGSLYQPSTTDAEGKPLVVKTGPNAGQPRVNYFFALAIAKGAEPHWAHTPWGAIIWANGNQAFPQAAQSPAFSWKIEDGDSQVPNKKGRKPCDNEGWPGHWILKFSGGFAPKIYQQVNGGYEQILTPDFVKPGYFVEVAGNVEGNGSSSQPGVYLNHSMICFRAYGQEIQFGPDVNAAGFGASPLPAGASATPPPGVLPMPALPGAIPAIPGASPLPAGASATPPPGVLPMPALPGAIPAIPGASPLPAGASATPPPGVLPMPALPGAIPAIPGASPAIPGAIPVVPNVGFVQVPPPVRQMTAQAAGVPYESYIAQGWSDEQLVQHGYMTA